MFNKRILLSFFIVSFCVFISCERKSEITADTLAVIENRTITKNDFKKRYLDFRRKTGEGVQDTYDTRKKLLSNMIDEEILIYAAIQEKLGDDRVGKTEHERIKIQQLLNTFSKKNIAAKVTVSDNELKKLYIRFQTKIKARHLYAPTREKADSLYRAVMHGVSFEDLAKRIFKDKKLQHSGGSLGYFTVDEMDPAFENAAFNLKIGEVSQPVRTSDGYSIIRVDGRKTNPVNTEYEFAKQKTKLSLYWRNRKIKQAVQTYSDSLSNVLKINFDEHAVVQLFRLLKADDMKRSATEDNSPGKNIEAMQLVRSRVGKWSIGDFQKKANFTSEKQKKWIHSKEDLKSFISGLIVREEILRQAKTERLDQTPEYQNKVKEEWETYLLTRMEDKLKRDMIVPEDSLKHYFDSDPNLFAAPAEINLREIVLEDKSTADVVETKLKSGVPFAVLAKQYSVRRWSAEKGGELGYLTPQDFGKWAPKVFSVKVNDLAGPVKMDSMIVFLKCIGKKPARMRSFSEAHDDVESAVRYLAWDGYRKSEINKMKKSLSFLKTYPEKLKSIRLN